MSTKQQHIGQPRRLFGGIIIIGIIVAIGLFVNRSFATSKMIEGYEETNGNVYECSRPIHARRFKNYGFAAGSEYRPASQAEANKYCHYTGIE